MVHLLYITVRDKQEARAMADKLLAERLIACANILDGVESVYRWRGETCVSQEALLLAKTTADKLPLAMDAARALHSYELPCIVALPLGAGLPAFLNWVAEEVE